MNASTSLQAKTIRVAIKKDDDLYIATSPDLKGLVVANTDIETLKEVQIPRAIEQLYLHNEVDVVAVPIAHDNDVDDGVTELWYPVPFEFIAQKVDEKRSAQTA